MSLYKKDNKMSTIDKINLKTKNVNRTNTSIFIPPPPLSQFMEKSYHLVY